MGEEEAAQHQAELNILGAFRAQLAELEASASFEEEDTQATPVGSSDAPWPCLHKAVVAVHSSIIILNMHDSTAGHPAMGNYEVHSARARVHHFMEQQQQQCTKFLRAMVVEGGALATLLQRVLKAGAASDDFDQTVQRFDWPAHQWSVEAALDISESTEKLITMATALDGMQGFDKNSRIDELQNIGGTAALPMLVVLAKIFSAMKHHHVSDRTSLAGIPLDKCPATAKRLRARVNQFSSVG